MPPQPLPGVLSIAPYKAGVSSLPGVAHPAKLSSNENPLGASAAARAAYVAAADKLHLYPDPSAKALRAAIAARYDLDPERIVCGAGSDEIFFLLGRIYLAPGDEIVQSEHGFAIYEIVAKAAGADVRIAKDRNYAADVDAMLAAVTPNTKIVWLANPNNPTGTTLPVSEVRRLHAGLPEDVLLVLDAAYAEYVRRDDYEAGAAMVAAFDNVIMTRTFSKIHGLAGLRVGWALASEAVVDALNRVRGPFNMATPAQAAAIAAIGDRAFVETSVAHNERERARMTAALTDMGYKVTPSDANFVLVHLGGVERRKAADAHLREAGVIVRALEVYRLPEALRISVGLADENDRALAALRDFASL
jgi:histidinol-phosphate aminotransferase